MQKQFVTTPENEKRTYSQAVVVSNPSTTVYLAGVVNDDENRVPVTSSFADATHAMFARLAEAMEWSGGTLSDIVSMTVFITDARWGPEFGKIRGEYFESEHYPASALIVVSALARPELIVEVQATAIIK